jgi:hypothetical protein
MHKSVKNDERDVTYVLKETRRRSKCVITEMCISAAYRISSSGSSLRSFHTNHTLSKIKAPHTLCPHVFMPFYCGSKHYEQQKSENYC